MNPNWMILVSQLAGAAPLLFVYLTGIILAFVWWRRAPRAAVLALAGLGVLLIATVLSPLTAVYAMNARGSTPAASVGQTVAVMGVAFALIRAVGTGLLVAAVFAGRSREVGAFPMEPTSTQPPLAALAPGEARRV
jgi:hypothetical protein